MCLYGNKPSVLFCVEVKGKEHHVKAEYSSVRPTMISVPLTSKLLNVLT